MARGKAGPDSADQLTDQRQTVKSGHDDQDRLTRRVQEIREGGGAGAVDMLLEPHLSPDYENTLHARYLQALQVNVAAQRRCAEATQRLREINADAGAHAATTRIAADGDASSTNVLQRHLKLLRLQKQHARLVCLRDEFEALKLARGLSSLRVAVEPNADITTGAVSRPVVDDDVGGGIATLAGLIESLMKGLEIAVVQDQHESERQAAMLESLKAQARPSSTYTVQQRVHALLSTRSELTAWVEEALEKCQDDLDGRSQSVEPVNGKGSGFDEVEMERKTDEEYERYLDARKRLLSAVTVLRTEVSEPDLHAEGPESSKPRKTDINMQPPSLDFDHTLGSIEKNLLPAMQQQNITQRHSALAEVQLKNENERVVKVIDRLSDESQLLQAYPMLAHSGRFQHASSVFGNKLRDDSVEQDQITQRIDPWLFSAEAADVAAAAGIEKQVKHAKEAIESVSRILTELGLLMEATQESLTFAR